MEKNCKLHTLSFALGLGVFWALVLFVTGLLATYTGYGMNFQKALNSLYLFYFPGFMGACIGAVLGFIDLFVAGLIIGWLYNFFLGKFASK